MANIMRPADIVDIGIEKEIKRRDFYDLAHKKFRSDKELGGLFEKLRDWEEEHVKKFREIREGVRSATYAESYPGEIEAYMQALVESELYGKITPEDFASIVKAPVDAIDMGISFEKDAILFFQGLSRFMDKKHYPVARKLIEEEQQHLIYLYELKKKMR